jgi:hypothetical protein
VAQDSGIYRIIHTESGRCYVGQTGLPFRKRWILHRSTLRLGKSSSYLQAAWNKYGEDAFRFEVIERCAPDRLTEREQFWIDRYQPMVYNLAPAGGSVLGITHTPEARERHSVVLLGNQRGKALTGIPKSDAHKAALRVPHPTAVRTQCRQGHPYDEANTYVVPSTGVRQCRICRQALQDAKPRKTKRRMSAEGRTGRWPTPASVTRNLS